MGIDMSSPINEVSSVQEQSNRVSMTKDDLKHIEFNQSENNT